MIHFGLFDIRTDIFILTIVFSFLSACIGGWDGMGLLFLAICSAILLFACGIGWGINNHRK